MESIFLFGLIFVGIVIVAIYYEKMMTPIQLSKKHPLLVHFHSEKWIFKPLRLIFSLFILLSACYIFLEGPELQMSKRWGYPIHNYAEGALGLLVGVCLLGSAIKRRDSISKKKDNEGSKKKSQK